MHAEIASPISTGNHSFRTRIPGQRFTPRLLARHAGIAPARHAGGLSVRTRATLPRPACALGPAAEEARDSSGKLYRGAPSVKRRSSMWMSTEYGPVAAGGKYQAIEVISLGSTVETGQPSVRSRQSTSTCAGVSPTTNVARGSRQEPS